MTIPMNEHPESEPEQLPLRIPPAGPDASDRAALEACEIDEQQRYSALRHHLEETSAQRRWLANRKEEKPTVNPLALL